MSKQYSRLITITDSIPWNNLGPFKIKEYDLGPAIT